MSSPSNKLYHVSTKSKRSPPVVVVVVFGGVKISLLLLLVICSDYAFLLATATEGASGSTGSSGSSGHDLPRGSGPPTPLPVNVPYGRGSSAALYKDRQAMSAAGERPYTGRPCNSIYRCHN